MKKLTLATRMTTVSMLALATLACLFGTVVYIQMHNFVADQAYEKLLSLAIANAREVDTALNSYVMVVSERQNARVVSDLIDYMDSGLNDPAALDYLRGSQIRLFDEFEDPPRLDFSDPEGNIILSTDRSREGTNIADEQGFTLGSARTGIVEIKQEEGSTFVYASGPMLGDNAELIGVIIARFPASRITRVTSDYTGLGRTGETVLGRREGDRIIFLTPQRHTPNATVPQPVNIADGTARPMVHATAGQTGVVRGLDYRGADAIAGFAPLSIPGWGLVVKQDEGELLGLVHQFGFFMIVSLALMVVLGIAVILPVMRGYTKPIGQLVNAVQRFSEQEWDVEVPESGGFEMETLARAFNTMVEKRKGAEALLCEGEERLRTTLMSIGDGVIVTDETGHVTMINSVAEYLTGWKQADAAGKLVEDVFAIVNEQTREPVENPVRTVEEKGLIVGLANSTLLISKDGTERPIADSGAPIRDGDHFYGVVLVFRDQTEERMGQWLLRESEERFKTFFDSAPTGMHVATPEGRVIRANQAFLNMLGYSEEVMYEQTFAPLTHPDDIPETSECFHALLAGEKDTWDMRKRYIRKDGGIVWAHVTTSLLRDDEGAPLYFLTNVLDITDRRAAEEAVRQASIYSRSLIEASLDPLVTISSDGKILDVNKATEDVTGIPRDRLIGTDFSDYFTEPDKAREGYKLVFEKGLVIDYPLAIRHTSGAVTDVLYNATVYKDEEGKVLGVFAAARDITERKKAEESLRSIKWMLSPRPRTNGDGEIIVPEYGDLTKLNTNRLILDSIGAEALADMASVYIDLLNTSSAIYEKTGDYALGIFSSGWCKCLDAASRRLCGTEDNKEALKCGKWLCHESCWSEASKTAIAAGKPVDIECNGGIHLYAVPIFVYNEVVGAINFGYGDPPRDPAKIAEIAEKYGVDPSELKTLSDEYEARPQFIIDLAKQRLDRTATLIGSMIESRLAGNALRESEERLRTTLMSIGDGVVVTDLKGRVSMLNTVAENLTGWKQEEAVGMPIEAVFNIVNEDSRKPVENPVRRVEREGVVVGLANHTVLISRDGTEYAIADSGAPIQGEDIGISGVVLVFRDITLEQMQQNQREFTLELHDMLRSQNSINQVAQDVTHILQRWTKCDAVGIRLKIGDDYPYFETSGFPSRFIKSENYLLKTGPDGESICGPSGAPILECLCGQVLTGNYDPSLPFFTAKGSFYTNSADDLKPIIPELEKRTHIRGRCFAEGYESVALIPLRMGGKTLGLLQFNDCGKDYFTPESIEFLENAADLITIAIAQRQAQEDLRASEEFFRSMIENMVNACAYHKMIYEDGEPVDYTFLSVNEAFYTMTGLTNVVGKRVTELIPSVKDASPDLFNIYGRVASTGQSEKFELYFEPFDKWYLVSASSPKKGHFLVVFDDITERKNYEVHIASLNDELKRRTEELETSNQELEAFSYSVSHDLRTPLRSIDGFSKALLEDYGEQLGDEGRNFAQRVRAGCVNMGKLIDDLLQLSRLSRLEMKPEVVDLSVAAKEVVKDVREAYPDSDVEIDIEENICAYGDNHLLKQLMYYLLDNAFKFTSKTENAEIKFKTMDKDGEMVYYVQDNGVGFDMAFADKLFGAFQRLHGPSEFPGTGIGLATAQRVIQRHNGKIWAEGEVGKGATFYFTLNLGQMIPSCTEQT